MTWWIILILAAMGGAFILWWLVQPIQYRNVTRGDLADCVARLLLHSLPGSWMSVEAEGTAVALELTKSNVNADDIETDMRFRASTPDLGVLAKFLSDRGFECTATSGEKLHFSFARPSAVSGATDAVMLTLDRLGQGSGAAVNVRMSTRTDPESLRVTFEAFQERSKNRALQTVGKLGDKFLDRRRNREKGKS